MVIHTVKEVEKKIFAKIPLLTTYNKIGGYVTWNTFKKKLNKEKYNKWYKGKQVINPKTVKAVNEKEMNSKMDREGLKHELMQYKRFSL